MKMVFLSNEEKQTIDLVEKTICSYFNVDIEDVMSRNHKRDPSLARGFIWYVLHYDCGLSISKIKNEYIRTRRSVFYLIAKIKVSIQKQKYYNEMYKIIKSKLNLNN